jgi:hypothetical protein
MVGEGKTFSMQNRLASDKSQCSVPKCLVQAEMGDGRGTRREETLREAHWKALEEGQGLLSKSGWSTLKTEECLI